MGLFDEIERSIKEAMAEAQKAQQKQRPQRESRPDPQDAHREETLREEARRAEEEARQLTASRLAPDSFEDFATRQRHLEREEKDPEEERRAQLSKDKKQRTYDREHPSLVDTTPVPLDGPTLNTVKRLLSAPNGLAAAIIVNEILGPPLALRKHRS